MFRTGPVRTSARRGVILLVVLFLLTLFAIVGLSFVLYADAEATAARLSLQAASPPEPDLEPELALAYFLGQLIYDLPDDGEGVYSVLRGHSLARLMYGANDDPGAANDQPFNGVGRLRGPSPFAEIDDSLLINYTYFPADGFLRDPERLGVRAGLARPRGPFVGGFNVDYTYPDLNNLFLAAARADGTVLLPSFHRPWAGFGSLAPDNPHWYDRSKPWLKYLVLRPRPADMGPGFPAPEDAGGDVKNLIGAPGGNDSVWLDLDAPVLRASDGRRYKPLFAPLILDLDNRVNLNVHGNARGAGRDHASNQGWGPWEVNPRRLSDDPADPSSAARRQEWANIYGGRTDPPWPGRYGGAPWAGQFGTPGLPGVLAPPLPLPRFYAPVDYDGCQEQAGFVPSAPLRLPGATAPFVCFPLPPAGYGNGSVAERAEHPALYAPLQPVDDVRAFGLANLEALLRHGDTGSPALSSELLRLCPLNFADPRVRRLVTTHSFDVDRPGGAPWLWQDRSVAPYRLAAGALHPWAGAVRFPTPEAPLPQLPDSEFGADWRANVPLGRLDLARPLPVYPAPDASGRITNLAAFEEAEAVRQRLARTLFVRLYVITGAGDPDQVPPPGDPDHDPERWNALRWLAQLAVNVVDFIDPDDYLTPFNWKGLEWLHGTELPRLLINEVHVEYANFQPTDFAVWVELHNPLLSDPALSDGGAARLVMPPSPADPLSTRYGIYQLVVTRANPDLRAPANARGDPDPGELFALLDFAELPPDAPDAVRPADGRYAGAEGGNEGFYVIGPKPLPGERVVLTCQSPQLAYQNDQLDRPVLLLRRLACPHLPPQPDFARPGYNPYVTIDSFQVTRLNNTRLPLGDRASEGRNQPYAAHVSQRSAQMPVPALADQPQHTFFRHNAREAVPPLSPLTTGQTLRIPFDWLVHLDRLPISPMELLHVSAFKPHELTQQFMTEAGAFQHHAPWFDQGLPAGMSARLYRLFEFLEARHGTGAAAGGRVAGKINLNTVWDRETLRALCDAQPSNGFTTADVDAIFDQLLSPGNPLARTQGPRGVPGPGDRPFRSLAAGFIPRGDPQYPGGMGIEDTLLRPLPGSGQLLFQVGGARHPCQQFELLTKVFNQATVRSNAFAVWLTVGFFEVTDDTTRPVRLGPEVNRAENRHVRHRMFAIVDRSTLVRNPGPRPGFDPRTLSPGTSPAAPPSARRVVPYFSVID